MERIIELLEGETQHAVLAKMMEYHRTYTTPKYGTKFHKPSEVEYELKKPEAMSLYFAVVSRNSDPL